MAEIIESHLVQKIGEAIDKKMTSFFIEKAPVLINDMLGEMMIKKEFDKEKEWVKGDRRAGELIGVSTKAMAMRRVSGFYLEGKDWKKEETKQGRGSILWNKDTLLNEIKG